MFILFDVYEMMRRVNVGTPFQGWEVAGQVRDEVFW